MVRLKIYGLALVVFVAIDFVWLGFVAPPLYQSTIGSLLRETPNMGAAVVFYLLYVVGISEFVVLPAAAHKPTRAVFGRGALFGLVAYATFDLTALAVLKDWSLLVTIIDMVWGTVLTGAVSAVTFRIGRYGRG